MLKRKRLWTLIILAIFANLSCLHIELPHHGVIRDAETDKPLKDVLVNLSLEYECYFPPPLAGTNSEHLGNVKTFTDINGEYTLPLKLFLLPPRLCFTNKRFTYFKEGYFWGMGRDPKLYKMTHYLNYFPYKDKDESSPSYWSTYIPESKVEIMDNIDLVPMQAKGLFLKVPGRKFIRIYASLLDPILYAYDDVSKDWLAVDIRGMIIDYNVSDLHNYLFIDSHSNKKNRHVYASKEKIFHATNIGGNTGSITAHVGNISAIAGNSSDFLTIEDNGRMLCHYGVDFIDQSYYSKRKTGSGFTPYLMRSFTVEDIPYSKNDDSILASSFKFIAGKDGHFIVITKTLKFWHVYKFHGRYDKELITNHLKLTEILRFPIVEEITAVAYKNDLYIAFKNRGIIKYDGWDFKEDPTFTKNIREALYPDISSLALGNGKNIWVIYAVTGDHNIYRFSLEGIPDYQVKSLAE